MTLPVLISVPHGGTTVPDRLKEKCLLSEDQIIRDGDEFSSQIYSPLKYEVSDYVSTGIARAVLDMNRAEGDIRKDGIVKTHTCWDEPIWKTPLIEAEQQWLIDTYHKPYHQQLTEQAICSELILAVDCHTMAAYGPPVGPDSGNERPQVCIGNVKGESCPDEWLVIMQHVFQKYFPGDVSINQPFAGGYITQFHGKEMPWVQLELSRGDYAAPEEKSYWVLESLREVISLIN